MCALGTFSALPLRAGHPFLATVPVHSHQHCSMKEVL